MLASCLASSMFANSTTLLAGLATDLLFIFSLSSESWVLLAVRAAYVWTLIIARPLANADFSHAPFACLWLRLRRGLPFSKDRDMQSCPFVGVVPEADSVKLASSSTSNSLRASYICKPEFDYSWAVWCSSVAAFYWVDSWELIVKLEVAWSIWRSGTVSVGYARYIFCSPVCRLKSNLFPISSS